MEIREQSRIVELWLTKEVLLVERLRTSAILSRVLPDFPCSKSLNSFSECSFEHSDFFSRFAPNLFR